MERCAGELRVRTALLMPSLRSQREAEKRSAMATKGHGDYQEVGEGDFLPAVTGSRRVHGLSTCELLP